METTGSQRGVATWEYPKGRITDLNRKPTLGRSAVAGRRGGWGRYCGPKREAPGANATATRRTTSAGGRRLARDADGRPHRVVDLADGALPPVLRLLERRPAACIRQTAKLGMPFKWIATENTLRCITATR